MSFFDVMVYNQVIYQIFLLLVKLVVIFIYYARCFNQIRISCSYR